MSIINIIKRRTMTRLFLFGAALLFSARYCRAQAPVWLLPPTDSVSSISSFSQGLARVSLWGNHALHYIDTLGILKTFDGPFDEAGSFHGGLAWVSSTDANGKTLYGYINKSGKVVIPCIYDKVQDFSCGLAAVERNGVWQYIDKRGKTAINDDYIITKMPYINGQQKEQMMEVDPPAFHSGRLLFRDKNGLYGYRDTSGRFVIPAQFDYAHDFTDGVAVVSDTVPAAEMKGDDTLSRLYNSLPSGPPDYQSRLIDLDGQLLFKLKKNITLDMSRNFSNGLCAFLKEDQDSSGWGVMNRKGQVIIAPVYRNEPMPDYDGVSFVQVDGDESTGNKDGYLITFDKRGNTIAKIPFVTPYGDLHDSNLGFHEGLMAVQLGDLWGYIDAKGQVVIRPQFDAAMNFYEGFAIIKTHEGKVGILRNPLNARRN